MSLADLVELFRRTLADGDKVRMGMSLVDGDELGTKAETDEGGADVPGRAGVGGHAGRSFLQRGSKSPCYFMEEPLGL
jgi:hypothetical protein